MKRNLFLGIRLVLCLAVLLAFVIPPASAYEGFSLCLIYNLFGVKCPTCGMTRAMANAFHFNFRRALQYNILIVLFYPSFWIIFVGDIAALILLMTGKVWVSPAERLIMAIDKKYIKWQ